MQKGYKLMVYEGENNYIFISYSHKDGQKVLPIVDFMTDHGFRVWYDAGIEAGTEWPEYIEEHLKNSSVVLVFMTPNTVESKNCRNEINFALDLDKEVLVVYLEDTSLVKGMRLQLNSTQSLFRKNHSSEETFLRELVEARILQNCRDGVEQKSVTVEKKVTSNNSASIVSNVCSIGANDENDIWPSGNYSQTINRDEFRVVFFHMSLLRPFGFSGKINNVYRIYNSQNNLIFEDFSTLEVMPDYDKISMGWILKGGDGSFVSSGDYRFVCSINGSPDFTYPFTVTSGNNAKKVPTQKKFSNIFNSLFGK